MESKDITVMHGEDWDIARIKEEPLNPDEITTDSQTSYIQQKENHFVKCHQSSDVDTKVVILKETWDPNAAPSDIKTAPKQCFTCLDTSTLKHEDEIDIEEHAIQVEASPESQRLHLKQKKYNVSSDVKTNVGIKQETWDPSGVSSDISFLDIGPIKISDEINIKGEVWCGGETSADSIKEREEGVLSKKVIADGIPSSESPRLSEESSKVNCQKGGFRKIFPNDANSFSLTSKSFHKDHRTTKEHQPHKSNICDLSYTQVRHFSWKKSHKCDVCDKIFTKLGHLKTHKLIHEGKKLHKCEFCDKSFTQLGNLNSHKFTHGGKKPHKCNVCDKNFTELRYLKRHRLTHEGKRPHRCNVCDKSFTELGNLKRHKLIHVGIKPHKCDVCANSFTRLEDLKTHKLIHEGKKLHKCDVCDKSFTLLVTLKTHKLIHENIKRHKCDVCDKSFRQKKHLKRHTLIHEGRKTLKCAV